MTHIRQHTIERTGVSVGRPGPTTEYFHSSSALHTSSIANSEYKFAISPQNNTCICNLVLILLGSVSVYQRYELWRQLDAEKGKKKKGALAATILGGEVTEEQAFIGSLPPLLPHADCYCCCRNRQAAAAAPLAGAWPSAPPQEPCTPRPSFPIYPYVAPNGDGLPLLGG